MNDSATIMINGVADSVLTKLITQLKIDVVLTNAQLTDILNVDPSYREVLRSNSQRALITADLSNITNEDFADVIAVYANGLLSVKVNKLGPRGITLPANRIYWGQLCVFELPIKTCCLQTNCNCSQTCSQCCCNPCQCEFNATRPYAVVEHNCCPDPANPFNINYDAGRYKKVP